MERVKIVILVALLALAAAAGASAVERPGAATGFASAAPPVPAPTRKIDEYGDIPFDDEKMRLDNFAIELLNDPAAKGYIIAFGGRRARAGEARRRLGRAKKYLVSVRKVGAARLVTIDGGHREALTVELYIIPPGMTPPEATPTVNPAEVEIIRGKPRPRGRRSRARARGAS